MIENSLAPDQPATPSVPVKRSHTVERFLGCGCLTFLILVVIALFLPSVQRGREAPRRSQCKNNLKQIGLALHNYHDMFGSFPPAYIADEYGRPLHSWRVLLLPFLDQAPLYNRYRFDEPWDGPNNSKLADQIGYVFDCPSENKGGGRERLRTTSYVAILGSGTAWPGSDSVTLKDFKDGSSNTILIAEVADSGIHWMEPRDLDLARMNTTINSKTGQGLSSAHLGGTHVLLADGAVRYLSETLPTLTLRALLTIRGGEAIGEF